SATICESAVWFPWPRSVFPVKAVTVPSAWMANHESSSDGSIADGHVVGASLPELAIPHTAAGAPITTIRPPPAFTKATRVNLVCSGGVTLGVPSAQAAAAATRLIARTIALWVAHR